MLWTVTISDKLCDPLTLALARWSSLEALANHLEIHRGLQVERFQDELDVTGDFVDLVKMLTDLLGDDASPELVLYLLNY
jgi:hypothetical protein